MRELLFFDDMFGAEAATDCSQKETAKTANGNTKAVGWVADFEEGQLCKAMA